MCGESVVADGLDDPRDAAAASAQGLAVAVTAEAPAPDDDDADDDAPRRVDRARGGHGIGESTARTAVIRSALPLASASVDMAVPAGDDDEWSPPPRRSYRGVGLAAGAIALVVATWTVARWTMPSGGLAPSQPVAQAPAGDALAALAHATADDQGVDDADPVDGSSAADAAGQRAPAVDDDRVSSRRARRASRRHRARHDSRRARASASEDRDSGRNGASTAQTGRGSSRTALEEAQAAALALADGPAGGPPAVVEPAPFGSRTSAAPTPAEPTTGTAPPRGGLPSDDGDHARSASIRDDTDEDARDEDARDEDARDQNDSNDGARGGVGPASPSDGADPGDLLLDPDAVKTPGSGSAEAAEGAPATAVDGAGARARFFVKLGRAQLAQGRAAEAEVSFARALGLEPGNPEARAGLADARSQAAPTAAAPR